METIQIYCQKDNTGNQLFFLSLMFVILVNVLCFSIIVLFKHVRRVQDKGCEQMNMYFDSYLTLVNEIPVCQFRFLLQ